MDFNLIDFPRGSQPEVHPLVRTGAVAATTEHVGALPNAICGNGDFASNRISRTFRPADQS